MQKSLLIFVKKRLKSLTKQYKNNIMCLQYELNKNEDIVGEKMEKARFKKIYILYIVLGVILITLLTLLGIFLCKKVQGERTVISIEGIDYNQNDYMMYLRVAKNKLFDENTTRLPKATLNTIIDSDTNLNTESYLRQKVEENLKIAGAIEKIAKDNDINLTQSEEDELEKEKQEFISKKGGKIKFYEFLYENRTNEKAYDKIARLEKLYTKVYNELYASGKKYDLTEKEIKAAKVTYESEYKKARQIFLLTVDPTTKKDLSASVIEQKKLLAETIRKELNESSDFDEYIKKYSDDAIDKDPPYDMYFKDGQMIKEVEETVNELEVGEISQVVKSSYGFHIIKRDALDDEFFNKYLESKRENKFLIDISNIVKECKIIIQDSFTTLKVD